MKKMAVIKNIGFGNRDVGRPVVWFDTYTEENVAALQVLDMEIALTHIKKSGVYDIKNLEGKTCWVEENNNLIKFLSFFDER